MPRYIPLKKIIWTNINLTQIRLKSSAVELAHKIHGPSPSPNSIPIFVLHGLLGSKKNWENMCKKMTSVTNMTVVAVDARNHGDSPHSASHNYKDLAADVSKLIPKFALQKVIIIGHSMGGRTGMVLALTEPSKVASLVVIDISPITTPLVLSFSFPKLIATLQTVDFDGKDTLHKAKTAAKDALTKSGIFDTNEEGMYFILMNIGKLPDESFGWKCNLDALKQDFHYISSFPLMKNKIYTGPTLFLGGRLSSYIQPEDILGIQKIFPNAKLQYIEGAGHNVHAEAPEGFLDAVIQFLSVDTINLT